MEQINHRKIAIKTLLVVLFTLLIILIFNSWANIRQMFNGNSPPLSVWLANGFKPNLGLLVGYGAYFYYRNYRLQKRSIQRQKVVEVQNKLWDKAQ